MSPAERPLDGAHRLVTTCRTGSKSGQPPKVQPFWPSTLAKGAHVAKLLLNPCKKMTGTGGLASTGTARKMPSTIARPDDTRAMVLPTRTRPAHRTGPADNFRCGEMQCV